MAGLSFDFDGKGIGTVLYDARLAVPVNQRPYAWRDTEAKALFQDIAEAIERDDEDWGSKFKLGHYHRLTQCADYARRASLVGLRLTQPAFRVYGGCAQSTQPKRLTIEQVPNRPRIPSSRGLPDASRSPQRTLTDAADAWRRTRRNHGGSNDASPPARPHPQLARVCRDVRAEPVDRPGCVAAVPVGN